MIRNGNAEVLVGNPRPRMTERQRRLVQWVASCYGVTAESVRRHDNRRAVKNARHMAFYLLADVAELSLADVGSVIGKAERFHHTTVLHGVRRIRAVRDERVEQFEAMAREILGEEVALNRASIPEPKPVRFVEAA